MASTHPAMGASTHASHGNPPASPTLTNPDMILPDYEYSPASGNAKDHMSSDYYVQRSAQAIQALNNMDPRLMSQFQQYQVYTNDAPATPIIYGNGTMLSDIGEVTEVESTAARYTPPRHHYASVMASSLLKAEDSDVDAALHSSPTMGKIVDGPGNIKQRAKAAKKTRRDSMDSNSTITDQEQTPVLVEFDDTISVGDSVFQGDDEESLASSYANDAPPADGPSLASPALIHENKQKYTTAQLSRRAEQILANAKKRLTAMEDNLSRARSSLVVAPQQSLSNPSSPSPPIAATSAALMMSTSGYPSPAASTHRRMSSDNMLRIGLPIKVYPQRSSSSLGVSNGPRQQALTISKSADQLSGQYNSQRVSYIMRDKALESLGENNAQQPSKQAEYDIISRYPSMNSPNPRYSVSHELSRSASTSQMRDIKDQVKDLKGKISSLREQARADSLMRRSLQGERTPSPFTYARTNQWYTSGTDDLEPPVQGGNGEVSPLSDEPSMAHRALNGPSNARVRPDPDEVSPISSTTTVEQGLGITGHDHAFVEESNYATSTDNGAGQDGTIDESVDLGYDEATNNDFETFSEDGDSIYHESVQHPISHEDREDAFDYEHFFLHSAMGTMSQRAARRGSGASYSSEDSTETTRGPSADREQHSARTRRGSDASISTIDTFATAEERAESRQMHSDPYDQYEDHDEYYDEHQEPEQGPDILERQNNHDQSVQALAEGFSDVYSSKIEEQDYPTTSVNTTFDASTLTSRIPQSEQATTLESAYRRSVNTIRATRAHAASVSSFESTGTTRSFPLVKRTSKANSNEATTPERLSFRMEEAKMRPDSAISPQSPQSPQSHKSTGALHLAHIYSNENRADAASNLVEHSGTTAVIETLHRDDQLLVERLVASLGRCVLSMTESSRASTEARMYRRRIDAARKILEGLDTP
ncbi:hypothetical protein BD289DRAFT_94725 [Coniella lustricola]|uniref:Uncharacterized protein n=1 Tax=Coniella lustricola TaxID=2025994 RepID=A0A2T2ZY90_9PEZI|nr:hypothetical protein BD289DRAFT_94725 [Coniella lustricola]